MMWSGSPLSLPPGWALCNGSGNYLDFQGVTRNIPDLRGRFNVGYDPGNGSYNDIGDQGGAASVTLTVSQIPSHNHGGSTSTDGNHTHTVTDQYRPTTLLNGSNFDRQGVENYLTRVTHTTSTDGNHSHTINSQGGGLHENRPPYYTLAYIIRVN
ncbi:hypothetical protein FNH22_01050 [Fulvivirga sp. M361]|uniref:phage baseplate protein n=1 Tax=Fulvivirga sp. M361 TaxID=2594266 RepID=UPI00117AFD0B|nr:hypothetical protein [Fulvivirga sp. M361]TRX62714.1 hypothetical protein FNH22_01050 [Fulvivirga sp. M361]